MNMNINFNNIQIKFRKVPENSHHNLLAFCDTILRNRERIEEDEHFTITGFTVWKSKYGGLNVELPQKKGFKYLCISPALKETLEEEILNQYQCWAEP